MRQFQKVLQELKEVVATHQPGDCLTPPASLPMLRIQGKNVAVASMGLDHGDINPAVVLLHGFGGFFMDWPRVMAPLSRHTRVYAIDLPGWGFSQVNRSVTNLEHEIEVVKEVVAKLGLKKVILCGISYGAGVTWAAATKGYSWIEHAVLLNPMPTYPMRFMHSALYQSVFFLNKFDITAFWGHRLMTKAQYKLICRENLLNERLLDSFYLDLAYMVNKQPWIPSMLQAHARLAREIDWADWEHRLAGIRVPTTILQGREDRIFSLASAEHLHRLIPKSKLIEVADCGHAIVFDQHRKVSDYILSLMARQSDRGRASDADDHSDVVRGLA